MGMRGQICAGVWQKSCEQEGQHRSLSGNSPFQTHLPLKRTLKASSSCHTSILKWISLEDFHLAISAGWPRAFFKKSPTRSDWDCPALIVTLPPRHLLWHVYCLTGNNVNFYFDFDFKVLCFSFFQLCLDCDFDFICFRYYFHLKTESDSLGNAMDFYSNLGMVNSHTHISNNINSPSLTMNFNKC